MNEKIFWNLARYLYRNIFRGLLKKAIDNPDTEWDDYILKLCDRIFDYDPEETLESGINHG